MINPMALSNIKLLLSLNNYNKSGTDMKKIISIFLFFLVVEPAFGGQVGGSGGGTAIISEPQSRNPLLDKRPVSIRELSQVFTGAKNISRESLGSDQLFQIDIQNRVVTFDAERIVLDESAVLTFEEVVKYGDQSLESAGE